MDNLAKTTLESFRNRLTDINQALEQENLVTKDFKVVEKQGIKWTWIKFTRAILKTFSCCMGDPWKAHRIDALAKSLTTFTHNNHEHLTPEIKAQLEKIRVTLVGKAMVRGKAINLEALAVFNQAFVMALYTTYI